MNLSKIIVAGLMTLSLTSCVTQSLTLTEKAIKMVSVENDYKAIVRLETVDGNFFCSGTVISDTTVLTAAHCFMYMEENDFVVSSIPEENSKGEVSVLVARSKVKGFNQRADVAVVVGDFRQFSKMKIDTNPESDILENLNKGTNQQYDLVACGFPYGGKLVCYKFSNPEKMVDVIGGLGQMFAGMSGGPVIDMKTGKILAVNHAVTQGMVLIAPIVNLYNGLRIIQ